MMNDEADQPIFSLDEMHEPDETELDDGVGRGDDLRLEGVVIPFELAQYGNGQLPGELLERIGISGHRLHPVAAAGFARLRSLAAAAGIDLTCTDSYRSLEHQVEAKKRKPKFTATPGRSVHGWGFAVDVSINQPPQAFGQKVLGWLKENGPPNGWHLGRPKDEPWHWVYRGVPGDPDVATVTSAAGGRAADDGPGTSGGSPSTPTSTSAGSGLSADEVAALTSTAEVALGASGPVVRIARGLLGVADGDTFDDATDAAVRSFQEASGLVVDGRIGPRTWAALRSATAPAEQDELSEGATGDAVRWVQRRLGAKADGEFGARTKARVAAFQRACALAADGTVGPRTWGALTS